MLAAAMLLLSVSCDKGREVRKYKKQETPAAEQKIERISPKSRETAPGRVQFSWDTPEGWDNLQKTSGMRLASFSIKSGNKESRCTIVPLRGTAGGIKANVMRWLGQINIGMEPGSKDFEEFLNGGETFKSKGQLPAVMFDFTSLTPGPQDQSILVTVLTMQDSTIFIKMTGEKAHLLENKEKFKALSQSFSFKGAPPQPTSEK